MTPNLTLDPDLDLDASAAFPAAALAFSNDRKLAQALGRAEIGFLVEQFYALQEMRKSGRNRERCLTHKGEPTALLAAYASHLEALEGRLKRLFQVWCEGDPLSDWALDIYGVGPIIAAGLAAHVNIARASSPSSVWRYAGLDPTATWLGTEKGEAATKEEVAKANGDLRAAVEPLAKRIGTRADTLLRLATTAKDGKAIPLTLRSLAAASARRPWNAALKVLCWKLEGQFVKLGDHPKSLYARLYRERKAKVVTDNEAGAYKDRAAAALLAKRYGASETRDAYEAGMYPAGRLDMVARRYAVKVFLANYWTQGWMFAHPGQAAPKPWIIAHGGHVDLIEPEVPYRT